MTGAPTAASTSGGTGVGPAREEVPLGPRWPVALYSAGMDALVAFAAALLGSGSRPGRRGVLRSDPRPVAEGGRELRPGGGGFAAAGPAPRRELLAWAAGLAAYAVAAAAIAWGEAAGWDGRTFRVYYAAGAC